MNICIVLLLVSQTTSCGMLCYFTDEENKDKPKAENLSSQKHSKSYEASLNIFTAILSPFLKYMVLESDCVATLDVQIAPAMFWSFFTM